jgi:hypothetical protein
MALARDLATDRRSRSPGGGTASRHVERPHAVGAHVAEGHRFAMPLLGRAFLGMAATYLVGCFGPAIAGLVPVGWRPCSDTEG